MQYPSSFAANRRLLLVDDSEIALRALERALQVLGYEVVATTNPVEALDLIVAGKRFDVLVTDLQMPHLDGIELIARVARAGIVLPSLIVSGAEGFAALLPPGQRWLAKPATAEELARELALLE
jgi:CheY-like chemotaxis protein